MLTVRTADDWAFSVDVTVGAATETFSNDADDSSAYLAMTAWLVWLNAPARAWTGTRTFDWTWQRYATDGGAKITLSAVGGTFTITGGANARLKLSAAAGVTTTTGTAGADGTWAPAPGIAVVADLRTIGRGDACGDGAVRPGVPALGTNRPAISAVATPTDAGRLAGVLAVAESPRRCHVWQEHTSTWRELALGFVQREASGFSFYRFTLEASGDAI